MREVRITGSCCRISGDRASDCSQCGWKSGRPGSAMLRRTDTIRVWSKGLQDAGVVLLSADREDAAHRLWFLAGWSTPRPGSDDRIEITQPQSRPWGCRWTMKERRFPVRPANTWDGTRRDEARRRARRVLLDAAICRTSQTRIADPGAPGRAERRPCHHVLSSRPSRGDAPW